MNEQTKKRLTILWSCFVCFFVCYYIATSGPSNPVKPIVPKSPDTNIPTIVRDAAGAIIEQSCYACGDPQCNESCNKVIFLPVFLPEPSPGDWETMEPGKYDGYTIKHEGSLVILTFD